MIIAALALKFASGLGGQLDRKRISRLGMLFGDCKVHRRGESVERHSGNIICRFSWHEIKIVIKWTTDV